MIQALKLMNLLRVVCCFYDPSPGKPMEYPQVRFLHYVGRYRPGRRSFSSPRFRGCRSIEGFSLSFRGGAAFMFEPQRVSDRRVKLWFPHRVGRYRLGGELRVRPWIIEVADTWKDLSTGDGNLSYPGGTYLLYGRTPAHQRLVNGVRASTTCGTALAREDSVSVPERFSVYRY